MDPRRGIPFVLALMLVIGVTHAAASAAQPLPLSLPAVDGPLAVTIDFQVLEVITINDEQETFELAGVLTSRWRDPRQAFDPAVAKTDEKLFQGEYQFNEIAPGWYPQVVPVNAAEALERHGVTLRVRPDGSSTLVESINISAKSRFDLRRFPYDKHRLEVLFRVLGFGHQEVVLQTPPDPGDRSVHHLSFPQWTIEEAALSVQDRSSPYTEGSGVTSVLVVSINIYRRPFHIIRLVVLPLSVIVLLSFSVFWMDRSSLADRNNISFIGILTGVAYQFVIGDNLPRISYFSLIHGFLNLSFFTMCATVVINIAVNAKDKRGEHELGDRIDRRCRWVFPAVYFGLIAVMLVVASTFY